MQTLPQTNSINAQARLYALAALFAVLLSFCYAYSR